MDDKSQDKKADDEQSALDAYRAAQREEEAWLERMRAAAKAKKEAASTSEAD